MPLRTLDCVATPVTPNPTNNIADLADAPQRPTKALHRMNIENIIERAAREVGIDLGEAAAALAREVDRGLQSSIIPDRRYRIRELEAFGFRRSTVYKALRERRLVIRKDGEGISRGSFILGADLLRFIEGAPILGFNTADAAPARRRGRPPKTASGAISIADSATAPSAAAPPA